MRCEVVAIGTELLLGQIVDTNSAWIGEQLALAGIDSHFQVKVGDNRGRMVAALRAALARSEAVICCGGLGPTQDDITREAIAEVMGVELVTDDEVAQRVREIFSRSQRTMSDNNLRQASVPVGAEVIVQTTGTAPGLICPVGAGVVYAVPGVPAEMKDMLARAVLPDLVARSGSAATIRSRTLRTWGLAESALAELIAPPPGFARPLRQPDHRLPGQRDRGDQGSHHRSGRRDRPRGPRHRLDRRRGGRAALPAGLGRLRHR